MSSAAVAETPVTSGDEWIGTSQAAEILGRNNHAVLRLARAGVLRMNRPHNLAPLFKRSDVERLARDSGAL